MINDFVERLNSAYPELPNRLGNIETQNQIWKLSGWFRRIGDIRARFREGLLDLSTIPARARARGASHALVEATTEEAQAQLKLYAMSAELIASKAKRSPLPLEHALGESFDVFCYSLCGYKPKKGPLLPFLNQDLQKSFERLEAMRDYNEQSDPYLDSRAHTGTTEAGVADMLAGRFDPDVFATTFSKKFPAGQLWEELWEEHLRPRAPRYVSDTT